MDEFLRIGGLILRWVLVVTAGLWFFGFMEAIGNPSDRAKEAAVMALGKAVICGLVAGIWFYRARREKDAKALSDFIDTEVKTRKETTREQAIPEAPVSDPVAASAKTPCIDCGAAISTTAKFCLQCGAPQSKTETLPDTIKCVACHSKIPGGAKFCPGCGATKPSLSNRNLAQAFESVEAGLPEGKTNHIRGTDETSPSELGDTAAAPVMPQISPRPRSSSSMYGGIIPFGIVVVLLAVACLVWFKDDLLSRDAQYNRGLMYYVGNGVEPDYAKAAYWFRKAADQGNTSAQMDLGSMYAHGQGVQQDYSKAAYWYRKAADQGDAPAQVYLGADYEDGRGIQQDYAQAAYWYRKAADQGDARGQCYLGSMYLEGHGVQQDDGQAEYWLRKAKDGNNESVRMLAIEGLNLLGLRRAKRELENNFQPN